MYQAKYMAMLVQASQTLICLSMARACPWTPIGSKFRSELLPYTKISSILTLFESKTEYLDKWIGVCSPRVPKCTRKLPFSAYFNWKTGLINYGKGTLILRVFPWSFVIRMGVMPWRWWSLKKSQIFQAIVYFTVCPRLYCGHLVWPTWRPWQ